MNHLVIFKKKAQIINSKVGLDLSGNICTNLSSACRNDFACGWVHALPSQTEVVCNIISSPTTNKSNLNELLDAVKLALSLAGFGNITTTIDTSEKSLSISADVAKGDR